MTSAQGITQQLAEFAASISYDDLPPEVPQRARDLTIDFIGNIVRAGGRRTRRRRSWAWCRVSAWMGPGSPPFSVSTADIRPLPLPLCTHPARLSITHKVCGDAHAERDVVEAVDATPHDDISRRRVPGSVEIPAEPGKAVGVESEIGWPPLPP